MDKIQKYNTDVLTALLTKAGIRPSVQRMAILRLLAERLGHPTADEIYGALADLYPTLSRTTVYNTLHLFSEKQIMRELETDGVKRYDLASLPPHAHFVCRCCGAVADIPLPAGLQAPGNVDFTVDSIELYYKGLCNKCKSSNSNL